MDSNIIFDFFQKLTKDNLSIIYQGNFSDDITEKMLALSEYNIENVEELSRLKNKVSFIMVECFQNILRHGNEPDLVSQLNEHSGIFSTRNIGSNYFITSANVIENANIESVKSKLTHINSLDKDELKKLYMEILSTGELTSKGGAGLGLIEMARKSGQPLEFEFERINDDLSFFYLQVKLKTKDAPEEIDKNEMVKINIVKEFQHEMNSSHIFLIYKGDFAQDSVMPVMNMIEDNMEKNTEAKDTKRKVYLILVEVLQNISKHSIVQDGFREGIFLIGKNKDRYVINTGNLVGNNQIESLSNTLKKINNINKSELDELYKKALRQQNGNGNPGIGLIDIAREVTGKMEYDFVEISKDVSFFSLCVQI